MSLHGFHFTNHVMHDYVQHGGNAIGERRIQSVPAALADLICGRVAWTEITEDPWEWRVSMARALNARVSLREAADLEAIANGRLTIRLLRLMVSQAWKRQVPARVAAALSLAALRHKPRLLPAVQGMAR
jgi:hypothetical protein